MSASIEPRLAGRQPSTRGGVPRVMTRWFSQLLERKRDPSTDGSVDAEKERRCVLSNVLLSLTP